MPKRSQANVRDWNAQRAAKRSRHSELQGSLLGEPTPERWAGRESGIPVPGTVCPKARRHEKASHFCLVTIGQGGESWARCEIRYQEICIRLEFRNMTLPVTYRMAYAAGRLIIIKTISCRWLWVRHCLSDLCRFSDLITIETLWGKHNFPFLRWANEGTDGLGDLPKGSKQRKWQRRNLNTGRLAQEGMVVGSLLQSVKCPEDKAQGVSSGVGAGASSRLPHPRPVLLPLFSYFL